MGRAADVPADVMGAVRAARARRAAAAAREHEALRARFAAACEARVAEALAAAGAGALVPYLAGVRVLSAGPAGYAVRVEAPGLTPFAGVFTVGFDGEPALDRWEVYDPARPVVIGAAEAGGFDRLLDRVAPADAPF